MKKIIITLLIIYVAGIGMTTYNNVTGGQTTNPFIWPKQVMKKVIKNYENN